MNQPKCRYNLLKVQDDKNKKIQDKYSEDSLCYVVIKNPQKDAWFDIFSHISMPDFSEGDPLYQFEHKIIAEAVKTVFPQLSPEELDGLTNYILSIPIIQVRLENINERLKTQAETVGLMTLQDIIGIIPELGDAIGAVMDIIYSGRKYKAIYDDVHRVKTEIIDKIPNNMDGLKKILKEQAMNTVHGSVQNSMNQFGDSLDISKHLNEHIGAAANAAANIHNLHEQVSDIHKGITDNSNKLNPDNLKQLTSQHLANHANDVAQNLHEQVSDIHKGITDNSNKLNPDNLKQLTSQHLANHANDVAQNLHNYAAASATSSINNAIQDHTNKYSQKIEEGLQKNGKKIGRPHKGGNNLTRKTRRLPKKTKQQNHRKTNKN